MKKVLVWGMGSSAKKFLDSIKDISEILCIGVTDTFADGESLKEFEGFEVFCFKEALLLDFDYLVICASEPFRTEIRAIIKECKQMRNMEKVVTVNEFKKIILKEQHEKLLANNDLYNFACNEKHRYFTKWFHYFDIYDTFFHKYRNTDVVMCEIGVFKGGSMQMWHKYFGKGATIIGIDIDEKCRRFEMIEENIHIEIGSQDDMDFWKYIKTKYPKIDILLDDGGHTMEQQIITFEAMFPHISDGGIYMCEDCHTSYWKNLYGGGLKKEGTFIEYSKNWIDDINAFHIPYDEKKVNYNTKHIAGLHYYDSVVVVEKNKIYFPFSVSFDE